MAPHTPQRSEPPRRSRGGPRFRATRYPFVTLPDYLARGLDLVFVGINPGTYSVARGHYFARSTNRFWPAFSRSRLSLPIRRALGVDVLGPEHDRTLLDFGIGFTDVVKRPSANAAGVTPTDFAEWAPRLAQRIRRYRPRVACFHGLTAYRPFARIVLGVDSPSVLGAQRDRLAETRLFVVPNPSPANAHFTVADQAAWYERLAEFMEAPSAA
ncbi:MAG: mismatch-specific DNA-glycosylase [Candidatus Rokubacteria bacterium]|nr:mismatch-specific DNA-glycosylase [Candidatus Rokubacteria bacterium]